MFVIVEKDHLGQRVHSDEVYDDLAEARRVRDGLQRVADGHGYQAVYDAYELLRVRG